MTLANTRDRLTRAELIGEVEHLLGFGVWPERIATQVGYGGKLKALRTYFEKYGRSDLSARLLVTPIPRDCRAEGMGGPCRQPPLTGRDVCRSHAKRATRG